jgi:hypothetical protein
MIMNTGDPCRCLQRVTGGYKESEVPLGRYGSRSCPYYRYYLKDNITLREGRGNTFIMFPKE